MVLGSPLHYHPTTVTANPYYPPQGPIDQLCPTQVPAEDSFSYFRYLDPYNRYTMDSHEEYLMRSSPFSTQSDSDTSISSIEVSPKQIQIQKSIPKIDENTRCGWRDCGLNFSSLEQLACHVSKCHSLSGPGGLFYCEWEGCNRNHKGFNARYKMLVHVRTHTNEKPHKCPQCEKSFSRAENLKIHSRSHSGEKPYVCTVEGCNKAYSNSSDRFKHTRTHSVDKPYQCKIIGCNKRYTDPSSLRKHVKTYKHFVNENRMPLDNAILHGNDISMLESESKDTKQQEMVARVSVITNTNDLTKYTPQTDDIYRLGSFLDIKSDGYDYVESFQPKSNLFKPYEYDSNMGMDVDEVPLDLSTRRTIS